MSEAFFTIMFDDLTEEAKDQYCEFMEISDRSNGNFDFVPIALIERIDDNE